MRELFKPISDDDDIRQGDIIRMINNNENKSLTFGVIVTADCDIAQKKAGERYTWLEIVPIKVYIEGPWAEEQLRKLAVKHAKNICDSLNSKLRNLDKSLSPLNPESLSEWLRKNSADEIFEMITENKEKTKADQELLRKLKGFSLTIETDSDILPLTKLKGAWEFFDTKKDVINNSARISLKETSGFQDYFILPELPRTEDLGFVVMLRSISTIMASDLYLTEQDARINDSPHAFHRLGRLNDLVRCAITQKLAFLFSRIGMPESFEKETYAAIDINIDNLFPQK